MRVSLDELDCPALAEHRARGVRVMELPPQWLQERCGKLPATVDAPTTEADQTERGLVGTLAHGAIGLAKNALGLDQASAEEVERRLAICRACDAYQPCHKGSQSMCCGQLLERRKGRTCGCIVAAKVRLASETCPQGKWTVASHDQREVVP